MKKIIRIIYACLIFIPFFFQSCMDVEPEEVLDYNDFYTGVEDADAGILGLYGQFMELADQVVVLNELKADLMEVTENATTDLEEINLNIPSRNNKWADVTKFYGVIQTCNDLLYNFDKMLKENKMIEAEYEERYSDVGAIRTWVYLQLGIHFGKIPYITEPVISLADLDKYKDKEMDLDQLLPELVRFMESLPSLENYQSSNLLQNIDGYNLRYYFIDKRCLMGDLYLYNDQYEEAAKIYRTILNEGESSSSSSKYILYNGTWTSGTPWWFAVLYRDGKSDDANSLYNGWRTMFSATTTGRYTGDELIWFMAYDKQFAPAYPFPELFNPVGSTKGRYYLKPSEYAVESVWGGEIQKNSFPFDARGLTGAYDNIGNNNYIKKFGEYETEQNWIPYRAGMLHLRYAEAANRAGYSKLAWSLVNDGLFGSAYIYVKEDGTAYTNDSIKQSGNSPFDIHKFPYNFDARWSDAPLPYIRGPWRYSGGVRGRAYLPNKPFATDDVVAYYEPNAGNKEAIGYMEKMIIREAALELGFEGHRWGDLVRVARRMNKENPGSGDKFLWDENIALKHKRAGTQADMSSESKWFLPLYY